MAKKSTRVNGACASVTGTRAVPAAQGSCPLAALMTAREVRVKDLNMRQHQCRRERGEHTEENICLINVDWVVVGEPELGFRWQGTQWATLRLCVMVGVALGASSSLKAMSKTKRGGEVKAEESMANLNGDFG